MRSKEKGNSSVIYKKRRLRGCEAGGVHHLDRVTAWPQAHWGGQWQRCDTGDAGGTLSPFVTPAQPSTHGNNHSSPFHPFSKLSFTLVLIFSPVPCVITPISSPFLPLLTSLFQPSLYIAPFLFLFTHMTAHFWSPEPFHPFHPQSLYSSYDLSISFLLRFLLLDLIYPASTPRLRSSQPHSFPLAESPLISIRLPSARGEMKIDSPSSNCFFPAKEKGEAVSWALSKAVHPSPFEVWRQGCSEISVALTVTAERWSMRDRRDTEQQRSRDYGTINDLFFFRQAAQPELA